MTTDRSTRSMPPLAEPSRPLSGVRVLIVEDEWILAAELEDRLSRLGCVVAGTASSGERALAIAAAEPLDLVLMDVRLKGDLDGVETTRRLLARTALPVVFVTAHTDDETIGRAQEAGAAGYLAKPVRERDLYATLSTVLQRHALEQRTQELNDLLVERTRQLEGKNRELDEFASIASHDLRAPLRNMLMLVDELTIEGTTPEDVVEITARIQRSGRRMQGLVDGLLALARAGSSAMAPADVDVTAVCQDVVADLDQAIAEASGAVRIPEAPVVVHADPTLLRQLLQNLVSNALKFRRAGVSPVVTIAAHVVAGGGAEIAVRDNGIGFEPGEAERLFHRFSRLHTGFEGSGIGLATCARIVERHGGSLRAVGEPNLGATFTVTLPAAPATGAPAGTPPVPAGTTGH